MAAEKRSEGSCKKEKNDFFMGDDEVANMSEYYVYWGYAQKGKPMLKKIAKRKRDTKSGRAGRAVKRNLLKKAHGVGGKLKNPINFGQKTEKNMYFLPVEMATRRPNVLSGGKLKRPVSGRNQAKVGLHRELERTADRTIMAQRRVSVPNQKGSGPTAQNGFGLASKAEKRGGGRSENGTEQPQTWGVKRQAGGSP